LFKRHIELSRAIDVYFVQEADRGVAFWHADDDAPGVYCCGVDLRAYNDTQAVRDCFAALVAAVAAHCRSRFTAEVAAPTSRLAGLPCETCTALEADDVRFRAGQISDLSELQLSPNGYPIGCCHRRVLGGFCSGPDTPRPAARR
jgi:hypothetical protein